MATEEDVRRIALALPETIERPWHGSPGFRVNLPAVDVDELTELITDSWRNKAPKRVLQAYEADLP